MAMQAAADYCIVTPQQSVWYHAFIALVLPKEERSTEVLAGGWGALSVHHPPCSCPLEEMRRPWLSLALIEVQHLSLTERQPLRRLQQQGHSLGIQASPWSCQGI